MRNINFLTQKPIAHRGLHDGDVAENSLIAFSRAIDAGYPIELDVQLTIDGKLVVFHDWTLDRMTGVNGIVSEMKCSNIQNLTLGNSNQRILLLEDVLNLVDKIVPIVIEIKSKSYFNFEICEKVASALKKYNGEFAISSFNPFVVRWFSKNKPEIIRGQNFTDFKNDNLVVSWIKRVSLHIGWLISNNKPDFFAIRAQMLPNSFPAHSAKKYKKPILTYAIKNHSEYIRIKNDIDNVFFDGNPYINN